jgi:hypothetical protein
MDPSLAMADPGMKWFVGHHDSKRATQVSDQQLRQALDADVSEIGASRK